MLVFYLGTGWYQTLHPNRNKGLAEKGDWISRLRSVHVDQVYPSDSVKEYSTTFFRFFVVLMSICLMTTIALGIYLAFRSTRQTWPVWLSLSAGIFLPILLLWLGQSR
jgi:hypothetical protein